MIVNDIKKLITIFEKKFKDIVISKNGFRLNLNRIIAYINIKNISIIRKSPINHKIIDENKYLKNAYEELIYENKLLKEDLATKLFELTEIENKNEFRLKEFKKIIDNQTSEITSFKRQLKEKEKDLNTCSNGFDVTEKELSALNQVINIYRSEGSREDTSIKEMSDFIKHHKCVIIGGHISWQDKVKTLLPNIRFVTADEVSKDISFLTNYNIIFFNESINSHSMFNKVKSLIDFKNIPFAYLGQHTNVELTVQSIYNELKHLKTYNTSIGL